MRPWIVLCAALGASGCGTEYEGTTEASTDPATADPRDAASAPEAAVTARDRSFVLAGVAGTPRVSARVLAGSDGAIQVDDYPTLARVPLRHGLLPLDYDGAFSPAFCADVAATAEAAALGPDFAEQAERMVRRGGSPTAHVPLSPFVGPAFEAALGASARAAGIDVAAPRLINPLQLGEVQVEVKLEPDALARALGVAAIEATLQQRLAQQRAFALAQGTLVVALPGKDLWCDLVAGKAEIVLRLRGTVAGASFEGATVVTGVVPL